MTLPYIYRVEARAEFDEAFDWYERRQPGLGVRFVAEVQACVERVTANPLGFAVVHRDVREALVNDFPFAVYFRVLPARVQIVSVFHTSRNPIIWKRRQ
jgi:plasmid stabilization system protein ParE